MDFKITIDQSGQAAGQQQPMQTGAPGPTSQSPEAAHWKPPGSISAFGAGSTGMGEAPAIGDMAGLKKVMDDAARKDIETAALKTKLLAELHEEYEERRKNLEKMKLRFQMELPALEAARIHEEDMLLRRRMLAVTAERHRLEGAAADETRIHLAQQKEAKEWQEKLNAERRKQDPASARAEDFEKIGGLMGQLSGGGGSMGLLGKILQMAPQFHEQFGGSVAAGGSSGVGGGAAAGADTAGPSASSVASSLAAQAAAAKSGAGAAGAAAGAAGGAAGGLAAMAGPVGLAITAVEMGAKKSADDIRGAGEMVAGFGSTIQKLNSNDFMGAYTNHINNSAKALEKIPIVGGMAAAGVEAFGMSINAAKAVIDSFVQRGAELEKFSGNIAMSRSVADVRSMMGDIREASVMGDVIARITDSSSEIQDMLRELLLPLKELAGETMSLFLDIFKAMMEFATAFEKEYGFIQTFVRLGILVLEWWRRKLGLPASDKDKDERMTMDELIKQNLGNFLPDNANQFGFGIGNNPLPGGGF